MKMAERLAELFSRSLRQAAREQKRQEYPFVGDFLPSLTVCREQHVNKK
jgi:hypothetical protein